MADDKPRDQAASLGDERLSVDVPAELKRALDLYAAGTGGTQRKHVEAALTAYLPPAFLAAVRDNMNGIPTPLPALARQ